ncbi:MAG TPA: RnfABCDGE type electron transport complex subunit D [Thermoplasmata archaeon]|nr:RnfABCDGE type electron transport complex subunit D [Thermoplasmata archaeon]
MRDTARPVRVSTSPHARDRVSIERIMYLVILALMFPAAGAVYFFGLYAILIMMTSVLTAVLVEYVAKMLRRRPFVMDGSAVITGLLLALLLPPRIPLWAAAIGAAVAIGIAKEAFGGLGHNIFNPALVGRAFLTASFAALMTQWVLPVGSPTADAVSGATPLGEGFVREGSKAQLYWDLFIGNVGGSLGETSALLILAGGLLLVVLRIINWRIPLFYIGTVAVLTAVLGVDPLFHVLAGGLMLGAFFMATDYVTAPLTNTGKIAFAVSAGALVVAIRLYGAMPEGVAFSILIMNGFTPLIDRYTVPQPYGYVRPEGKRRWWFRRKGGHEKEVDK